MWDIECTVIGARPTPGRAQLACWRELMNTRVAVAVRREQVAVGGGDHLGRRVERAGRSHDRAKVARVARIGWRNGPGNGSHQVTLGGKDMDSVPADVGAVQQVVDAEGYGVGRLEQTVAERTHEGAVRLEHDDWMVGAARTISA